MEGFFQTGPCSAQLNAIHRISSALFATADVDAMLLETLEVSIQTADAEAGSILLYDRNTKKLVFRHALGPVGSQLVGQAVDLDGSGKCANVYRTGVSDISAEGFDEPATTRDAFRTRSALTTAIRNFGGQPIGVVQVLNKRNGQFDTRDKELLEIVSAMAATVIDHAQRAEERKQAALAQILMFAGHQLKNKTFIITEAYDTFGSQIQERHSDLVRQGYPEANALSQDFNEFCEFVNKASGKSLKLAMAMNEYADRSDFFLFKPSDLKAALLDELPDLVDIAAKHGDTIDLTGLEDVPLFRCDAVFVTQAVYNLVDNAMKALASTRDHWRIVVTMTATADGKFPEGNYVEIAVIDEGPGIPKEKLEQILRGEAEADPNKRGSTGIGTRIVYFVAQTHDGLFLGESEVGKGTTFRLRLPMKRQG